MAQFEDLDDDCLLLILDLLLPEEMMQVRVNKRLKQLVTEKMRGKIKAIRLSGEFNEESECKHLGPFNYLDQELSLKPVFKDVSLNETRVKTPEEVSFLNLLAKFDCIKSIDFGDDPFPCGLLLEVFQRCPQLECIRLGQSVIKEEEWSQALDQFGRNIVHFAKIWWPGKLEEISWKKLVPSEACLLEMVAAKCANIRQVYWRTKEDLFEEQSFICSDLMSAFKSLPKNCEATFLFGHVKLTTKAVISIARQKKL